MADKDLIQGSSLALTDKTRFTEIASDVYAQTVATIAASGGVIGAIVKDNATGAAAIALNGPVPASRSYQLVSVTCNFDLAPTTSEDFTITLNANAGAVYDTLLYSLDPSAGATSDIVWYPDEEQILEGGDRINVAFANTDTRTYGAQITFKAVG